jgi:hypothetical protein
VPPTHQAIDSAAQEGVRTNALHGVWRDGSWHHHVPEAWPPMGRNQRMSSASPERAETRLEGKVFVRCHLLADEAPGQTPWW